MTTAECVLIIFFSCPLSTIADKISSNKEGSNIHSLRLLRRGKAMSGAPSIRGNSQFPNPPISTGITKKKIMAILFPII